MKAEVYWKTFFLFCATMFWLIPVLSLWPVQWTWCSMWRFFIIFCLLNRLKEWFIFCISSSKWTWGFYFFPHLSSCKTVMDTCSICACPGDQSCAFQLHLLPGGCCLAVLGHVRSGESSCGKVQVWHLREDCFSIATISCQEEKMWIGPLSFGTAELLGMGRGVHRVFEMGIWCDK